MGGASDPADDHCVKEDAQLLLLLLHFVGPVGEAETAKTMVGRTGREGVRYPAPCADLLQRVLPALLEPIPNRASTSSTSAPMMRESRMLPTRSLTESG